MRRPSIKPQARLDLIEIWQWIARNSAGSADRMLAEVYDKIEYLREWAGTGHTRDDVPDKTLYFYTVKPYLIAYRFDAKKLSVARVVHGARDFKRIFKKGK